MEIALITSMVIGTVAGIVAVEALNKVTVLEKEMLAQKRINVLLIADDAQTAARFCQVDPEIIRAIPDDRQRALACDAESLKKINTWEELLQSSWLKGESP